MGNVFFIGDTHFGHKKLIESKTSSRNGKFLGIAQHDQKLAENWNSVVRSKDVVYHLGDVSFGNLDILGCLRGYKKLILGNHDNWNQLHKYFDRCFGAVKFRDMILTHVPVHPNSLEYRFKYNIHGHLHDSNVKLVLDADRRDDPRYINVSVEQINYCPVSIEEIYDIISKRS